MYENLLYTAKLRLDPMVSFTGTNPILTLALTFAKPDAPRPEGKP